jgi:hypothetical protein
MHRGLIGRASKDQSLQKSHLHTSIDPFSESIKEPRGARAVEQEFTPISRWGSCDRDDDRTTVVNSDVSYEGASQDFFKVSRILTSFMGRAFDSSGSLGRGVACHRRKGNLTA